MQLSTGTAAVTTAVNICKTGGLIVQGGLAGAEVIDIQVHNGVAYQAYLDSSNAAIQLTLAKKNVQLPVGNYQLVKALTAGVVSIAAYGLE